MEGKFDCLPIEKLELDAEIIRKLKKIFIYTIGDLQLRTTEALLETYCLDKSEVIIINNALTNKTQKGLNDSSEIDDLIGEGTVSKRTYRSLMRTGISRCSEVIKLSKVEIQMIDGMTGKAEAELESFLRQYYGEEFDSKKDKRMEDNPNTIGLGHLGIGKNLVVRFREAGIYTIGDFQRKIDSELLECKPIINEDNIRLVKRKLEELKISRFEIERTGLGTWD